jgi:hypothetical protein
LKRCDVVERAVSSSERNFPKDRIIQADAHPNRIAAAAEPLVEADGDPSSRALLREVRFTCRGRGIPFSSADERVGGTHEVKTKPVSGVGGSATDTEIGADRETTDGQATRWVVEYDRSPLPLKVARDFNVIVTWYRVFVRAAEPW